MTTPPSSDHPPRQPNPAPSRGLRRSRKRKPARRIAIFCVGGAILLVGAAISPLPGPGFTILGPLGLAILATEFAWARRLLTQFESGALRVENLAPWIASPWAVALLIPVIAVYWIAAFLIVRTNPENARVTWALAAMIFLPISALATVIALAARRRWLAARARRHTMPRPVGE